jgi:protein gp37
VTKIEWADKTWNPIVGCSLKSPGCTHCYAMRMAARLERMGTAHYAGLTQATKAGAVWTGRVALAPARTFNAPLHWSGRGLGRRLRIFVCSMGDLFHENVPDHWIDRVIAMASLCPQHDFLVLTKRSARMFAYMTGAAERRSAQASIAFLPLSGGAGRHDKDIQAFATEGWAQWPLPNVWLGVSAEDQARADERIPDLLDTPAAVRFVSAEPLLGPIDFSRWLPCPRGGPESCGNQGPTCAQCDPERTTNESLDQIIAGGESGPGARPMHPDWARSIRDQCAAAGVAFFMKQMDKKVPIPGDLMIRQWPHAAR